MTEQKESSETFYRPADWPEYQLRVEHENGEHEDTRRGDCPLCEEAFGHDDRTNL